MLLQEILLVVLLSTKFRPSCPQYTAVGTKLEETEDHNTLFFVTDDVSMKTWKCHGVAVQLDWIVVPYDCMRMAQPEKTLYVAFYAPGERTRTFIPIFGFFLATFPDEELAEDIRTYFFARLILPLPKNMPLGCVRDGSLPAGTECQICGILQEGNYKKTFSKISDSSKKGYQQKPALYCVPTAIVQNEKCFKQFEKDLSSSVWDKHLVCTMARDEQPEVMVTDKGAALICDQQIVGLTRNEWSHFDVLNPQRKENKRFPIGFLRFDSLRKDFQFIKSDLGSNELQDVLVKKDNVADEQKYPFIASIKHIKQHLMTAVFIQKRFLLGYYPKDSVYSHYINNHELANIKAELSRKEYDINYIEEFEVFAILVLAEDMVSDKAPLLWSDASPGGTASEPCMVIGRPNVFSATAEQKHVGEKSILVFQELTPNPHKADDKTFRTMYHGFCFGDNSTPMLCRGLLYAFFSWNFRCANKTTYWDWYRVTPHSKQILDKISTMNPNQKPNLR